MSSSRRNAVHERGDPERGELLLAHAHFQFAHAAHADQPADARQPEEAVGVLLKQLGGLVVGDTERHGADDADAVEQLHVVGQLGLRARILTLGA
jgi:hypothetical protein